MRPHETCPRCKDAPEECEVGMLPSGRTEPDPWPAWAAGLQRVRYGLLRCPDCGTEYTDRHDQTHDHWWNDSWTVLTRVARDD